MCTGRDDSPADAPRPDPMGSQADNRSASAKAYGWASQVVSIAMSMVAPPLLGWLLSGWLGAGRWEVLWISLGGALGLWLGLRQLLQLARESTRSVVTKSDGSATSGSATSGSATSGSATSGSATSGSATSGSATSGDATSGSVTRERDDESARKRQG